MKEYLITFIELSDKVLKYGNTIIAAFSKRGVIDAFKVTNKGIILSIIELD